MLQLALIALTIMVLKHLDVAPEVDDLLARRAFDLPLLTGVVLDDMLRNLFQGSCTSSFNNLFFKCILRVKFEYTTNFSFDGTKRLQVSPSNDFEIFPPSASRPNLAPADVQRKMLKIICGIAFKRDREPRF